MVQLPPLPRRQGGGREIARVPGDPLVLQHVVAAAILPFLDPQRIQAVQQLLDGDLGHIAVAVVVVAHILLLGICGGHGVVARVLEERHILAQLRVLLQLLHEPLLLLRRLLRHRARLGRLHGLVVHLHVHALQHPGAAVPARAALLPLLLIRLLHQHHLRHLRARLGVHKLYHLGVAHVQVGHVVAPRHVARVQDVAQVRLGHVHLVVHAKVACARHLRLRQRPLVGFRAQRLDVKHHILHQLLRVGQWSVRLPEESVGVHLVRAERRGVHEQQRRGDADAKQHGAHVAVLLAHLGREAHQVILADGRDLNGEGVLVVVVVLVLVVAHQLLVVPVPNGDDRLQKVDKLGPVRAVGHVEVDALVDVLDLEALFVRAVPDNELLEVEEGTLVRHMLPDLNAGRPRVGVGVGAVAVQAHERLHDVLHLERLLQDGAVQDLLLHRQLGLQPSRVRLRPDERRVNELDLLQPLGALYAKGEQLLGLQVRAHPVLGRLQVAVALLAPQHADLLLDALRDVHLGLDAVDAHVGGVGLRLHAAQAA
mmetsp:Transcript_1013/g.2515  ORF Transcript_1013/g.2515 Transcript_1013/m.2515 type:complete len:539 (+) Transcript_1013:278-1894(+)